MNIVCNNYDEFIEQMDKEIVITTTSSDKKMAFVAFCYNVIATCEFGINNPEIGDLLLDKFDIPYINLFTLGDYYKNGDNELILPLLPESKYEPIADTMRLNSDTLEHKMFFRYKLTVNFDPRVKALYETCTYTIRKQ